MASKPVMIFGNLVSMILAIAGILQAVSWTIAGAIILAMLSITTLAPSSLGSKTGTNRSATKKASHSGTVEAKGAREKVSDKQSGRTHQPQKQDQRPSVKDEPARTLPQNRPDFQKAMAPKIAPPKTVPTSFSPAKPGQSRPSATKQEAIRPIPVGTSQATQIPTIAPPRVDPNLKTILKGDYETYDLDLGQRMEVNCEVTANAPVNVYIMDAENLNSLDLGEEFWSESGEEGVETASLRFVAPRAGKWFLVVENTDTKEVSATATIRKSTVKNPGA